MKRYVLLLSLLVLPMCADEETTIQNRTEDVIFLNAPSLVSQYGGDVSILGGRIDPNETTFWFRLNKGNSNELLVIRGRAAGLIKITNGYAGYRAKITELSSNVAQANPGYTLPHILKSPSEGSQGYETLIKVPKGPWTIKLYVAAPMNS